MLGDFSAPDITRVALDFSSPITVICGPNGAGKTRLLKALAQTLGCASGNSGEPLGASSPAVLRYRFKNVDCNLPFSPGQGLIAEHGRAHLLEPAHYAMAVLEHLRNTANKSELLEAYSPVTLGGDAVKSLSYLVNRSYDSIRIYEVDDPGGTLRTPVPLPYFEVESFGRSYGSESMGLGELSVFCLWWNLSRLDAGSVVLVDEPEAFTSPHTQYALVDELVRFCVQKELTVIVATQSQPIIDSFKADMIRMLVPSDSGVTILASPPKAVLLNTLGMLVQKHGLLLVEDRVSALVTTSAIGFVAADLLQVVDLVETDGVGLLEQALRMPRFGNNWFHLVGVFDGDQRQRDHSALQWPIVHIPGSRNPESELRSGLQGREAEAAAALGRSPTDVQMAQSRTAGLDDHDWLTELANALGVSLEQLVAVLVRLWFDIDRASFGAFVEEIRTHISE